MPQRNNISLMASRHHRSTSPRCSVHLRGVLIAVTAWLALGTCPSSASVIVSSAQTENMSCAGGVCAPTATDAILNVSDLETMLASGNVEVTTTGSGIQATDIGINAPLSWSSAGTLTLDAYRSIAIGKPVSVEGLSGMTLTTNDGGSNGTLSFGESGKVTFQNMSSTLVINGTAYTLVKSLPRLAKSVKANSSGSFALADSYDAKQEGIYDHPPIASLSGAIEGLGNTISRLSITVRHHRYVPAVLVEAVRQTGVIANLRLAHIHYRAVGRYAGTDGLVGDNEGTLFGDAVSGSMDAKGSVAGGGGGLVGSNEGLIVSCSADVTIVTTGNGDGGGFVGSNDGTITLSRATGSVSGAGAGGFVVLNEGVISEDFATGSVNGSYPGGLAGGNEGDGQITGTIANSYSTGSVNGSFPGGLVEEQTGGSISDSYAKGAVSNGGGGFGCMGAFNLSDDYWDTSTSGTDYGWCDDVNMDGLTGLTTKQLKSGLPPGFDPSIWAEDKKINNGFPYLINNPPDK